jgi:hypothetical protein
MTTSFHNPVPLRLMLSLQCAPRIKARSLGAGDSDGTMFTSSFANNRSSPSTLESESHLDAQPSSSDLISLLNAEILQALAAVYISCCHRKAYSFFHEEIFRQNLDNANLPAYLLLAFVATAVRFSVGPCFAGCQTECRDTYAMFAWSGLRENALSKARNMDVKMVQAASMLGIVDYTDGHLERKKVALLLTTLRRPSPTDLGRIRTVVGYLVT